MATQCGGRSASLELCLSVRPRRQARTFSRFRVRNSAKQIRRGDLARVFQRDHPRGLIRAKNCLLKGCCELINPVPISYLVEGRGKIEVVGGRALASCVSTSDRPPGGFLLNGHGPIIMARLLFFRRTNGSREIMNHDHAQQPNHPCQSTNTITIIQTPRRLGSTVCLEEDFNAET